jgi:hypothetical protein
MPKRVTLARAAGADLGLFAYSVRVVAGNHNHHDLRRPSALIERVKMVAGDRNHLDLLFRAAA